VFVPPVSDSTRFTDAFHLPKQTLLLVVAPLALAALAAGADGIIVEVHPDPDRAASDGAQSLTCENFAALLPQLSAIAAAIGRHIIAPKQAVAAPALRAEQPELV
jgi:3-deoxy-D-manno-octulosonic acid (KDO) 8-phosphate synthase